MDWLDKLLSEDVLPIFIPIIAIVAGIGYAAFKSHLSHVERMEKIKHGIDPDANKKN